MALSREILEDLVKLSTYSIDFMHEMMQVVCQQVRKIGWGDAEKEHQLATSMGMNKLWQKIHQQETDGRQVKRIYASLCMLVVEASRVNLETTSFRYDVCLYSQSLCIAG